MTNKVFQRKTLKHVDKSFAIVCHCIVYAVSSMKKVITASLHALLKACGEYSRGFRVCVTKCVNKDL